MNIPDSMFIMTDYTAKACFTITLIHVRTNKDEWEPTRLCYAAPATRCSSLVPDVERQR